MKLLKRDGKHDGFYITLVIGKRENVSWWSSPPNKVDHVGLSYLTDRYPLITTRKRAEDFKELYANLWVDATKYQKELMEHCIGLNYKNKPYRNYFYTDCNDKDWNELVAKGLANKSKKEPDSHNCIYFWLTKQGVEFILGKLISNEVYREL